MPISKQEAADKLNMCTDIVTGSVHQMMERMEDIGMPPDLAFGTICGMVNHIWKSGIAAGIVQGVAEEVYKEMDFNG